MVEINETFNANEIPEDDRNFDPIPAGDYNLQVIESKIEDTKTGSGQMLTLTLEVIDGPLANRRIWDRLNIVNQNPDAQRIAQRNLADLCLAVNVPQLRDTDDLHFKPFIGRVTIRPSKDPQYGPSNSVRYAFNQSGAARPAATAGAAAKAAPKGGGKPAAAKPPGRPWGSGGAKKPDAASAAKEVDDKIPF